jgi:hypothetical protein
MQPEGVTTATMTLNDTDLAQASEFRLTPPE